MISVVLACYYCQTSGSSSDDSQGISGLFGGGLLGFTVKEEVSKATVVMYIKLYHTLTPGTSNGVTYSARTTSFDRLLSFARLFRVYGQFSHSRGQGELYPRRDESKVYQNVERTTPFLPSRSIFSSIYADSKLFGSGVAASAT
jgi:hypothetical protein